MAYPKIRLFTTSPLESGSIIELTKEQSHYLANVMRAKIGDNMLLFNDKDGEHLAEITSVAKKSCSVRVKDLTKAYKTEPDIWLCFAPVKNTPINNIIQKATELGINTLQPVITKHTIVTRVNTERLYANAIEASEQCGRISVPKVKEPINLDKLLSNWDQNRKIFLCDESGHGKPMPEAILELNKKQKYAVLIGPEGGFAQSEFAILAKQPYIIPVTMGPRILRADTACIVALSLAFSILGDWDEKPNFNK